MSKFLYILYAFPAVYIVFMLSMVCWKEDFLKVWEDWQTFSAAMVALISSAAVLHATQLSEKNKKKRNFIAVKSMLPQTFADFLDYIDASINTYGSVYAKVSNSPGSMRYSDIEPTTVPIISDSMYSVIREAISYAPEEFSKYLYRFLVLLQVQNSRMQSMFSPVKDKKSKDTLLALSNVEVEILSLCYMQAMLSNCYPFIRNGCSDFKEKEIDLEDIWSSFHGSGLHSAYFPTLEKCFEEGYKNVEWSKR